VLLLLQSVCCESNQRCLHVCMGVTHRLGMSSVHCGSASAATVRQDPVSLMQSDHGHNCLRPHHSKCPVKLLHKAQQQRNLFCLGVRLVCHTVGHWCMVSLGSWGVPMRLWIGLPASLRVQKHC
jgi:hypothetical protein